MHSVVKEFLDSKSPYDPQAAHWNNWVDRCCFWLGGHQYDYFRTGHESIQLLRYNRMTKMYVYDDRDQKKVNELLQDVAIDWLHEKAIEEQEKRKLYLTNMREPHLRFAPDSRIEDI